MYPVGYEADYVELRNRLPVGFRAPTAPPPPPAAAAPAPANA
jgi:hypothetical protein